MQAFRISKISSAIQALKRAHIEYHTNNDGIHILCDHGKYDLWPTKNHWRRKPDGPHQYSGVDGLILQIIAARVIVPSNMKVFNTQESVSDISSKDFFNAPRTESIELQKALRHLETLDFAVRELQQRVLELSRLQWRTHA